MEINTKTKNLNEVLWLRVYAIIVLVAWHSYCPYTSWNLASSPLVRYNNIIFGILAPTANMPLFTFLSGYLFYYLHKECGKYQDYKGFLKNKARRLFIPYLVLGFVINMTQFQRMHPIDLFWGTPNHMWYCLMLFYCFIICWFVEKKIGSWLNYILAIASFVFVLYHGGQYLGRFPFGLYMPAYFYFFFYLGYWSYRHRDVLFKRTALLPMLLLLYLLSLKLNGGGYFSGVSASLFIIALLILANRITIEPPDWIRTISKYSFGIYVFHQWIIWNVTHWRPMIGLMNNHYVLFPIILFVSAFLVSTLLTHFSMKTKAGRFLLV